MSRKQAPGIWGAGHGGRFDGMGSSINVELHAVAFLYDHLSDFPLWIRKLTPGQLEHIAKVMTAWHGTVAASTEIVPLNEVEKRCIARAISLCQGDIARAALGLGIGKTTLYRKLKEWGYSVENRLLIHQASALAGETRTEEHGQLVRGD